MSNISKTKSIAFVILIGGRSHRFGSDKGLFQFLGKPLIQYQIEVLSQYKHDIFIVSYSQDQIQKYVENLDYRMITAFILDERELIQDINIRAPMIGMYSAFKELNKLEYESAFFLSCDMPLIKSEIINLLLNQSKGHDCCIPIWKNQYIEPLFAIYPVKKGFQRTKNSLRSKRFKLLNLLDNNWKIKYISIENEIQPLDKKLLTFTNINKPDDIEKLMHVY